MEGVEVGIKAGQVAWLVTNEGAHPASKWAHLTAKLIVEPAPEASIGARFDLSALRVKIEKLLCHVFEEAKAHSSPNEIVTITRQAASRIADLAKGSRWEFEFSSVPIRWAIEELIRRNLASCTEIAARIE